MTKAYPSNLTWEQWELIAHLFPEAKPGGRPRSVSIYAIINAMMIVCVRSPKIAISFDVSKSTSTAQ